jgi:hypothetical protein
MTSGYAHPLYAAALKEIGEPLPLPNSGGYLLVRPIPGSDAQDAVGCYPLFACDDWSRLDLDLAAVERRIVTAALVADPFGDYSIDDLHRNFDRVVPFKEHVVVEMTGDWESSVTKHHRYYARRSIRRVDVERVPAIEYLDEWVRLYDMLIQRHDIDGARTFSRQSFTLQMQVPGLVAFAARSADAVVGMQLWYVAGDVAYSHLLALDEEGYERMASYALHSVALRYFADRVQRVSLGGAAGIDDDRQDGLSRFKRGWSDQTRTAYFCGRIFDHQMYDQLVSSSSGERRSSGGAEFFPGYRASR